MLDRKDYQHTEMKHSHISLEIPEVYEVYNQLQNTILEMDEKIQQVIKVHQAEFLFAYRNHIRKLKEELTEIKQRADQQEKKMLSNDRGIFLEKQVTLFRDQALKLYEKLEEKTQQAEIYKSKVKEFEKIIAINEKQSKELTKNLKIYQAKCSLQEAQIVALEDTIANLKKELSQVKPQKKTSFLGNQTVQIQSKLKGISKIVPTTDTKQLLQVKNTNYYTIHQDKVKKTLFNTTKDSQLKEWFLECLRTIRKEVAQRKNYGVPTIRLQMISSLEQFKMIDKLRLLQLFMQNQKLIVWMYEKIFPDRMNQIRDYLTSSNEQRQKPKTTSIKNDANDDLIFGNQSLKAKMDQNERKSQQGSSLNVSQLSLPKVSSANSENKNQSVERRNSKPKKIDVRNRIVIKNGKLNLSSFD